VPLGSPVVQGLPVPPPPPAYSVPTVAFRFAVAGPDGTAAGEIQVPAGSREATLLIVGVLAVVCVVGVAVALS
jgi:hypothetical protein